MKRAALGFRMHSGWGVLVAVSGSAESLEIVTRKRIEVIDPRIQGAKQPYHHAATLDFAAAEQYLATCASSSQRLASGLLEDVTNDLAAKGYRVAGAAVLQSSGRTLPSLEKILASHPLLHTAEGKFFRDVVKNACEGLKIPVTAISARELEERCAENFGKAAKPLEETVAAFGRRIGPPWTQDHKLAALAAAIALT